MTQDLDSKKSINCDDCEREFPNYQAYIVFPKGNSKAAMAFCPECHMYRSIYGWKPILGGK